ncbi:MAG TPA: hypothetical protein VGI39_40590 [Polyangiaceae bacterium]|jgi:hypothetical protein
MVVRVGAFCFLGGLTAACGQILGLDAIDYNVRDGGVSLPGVDASVDSLVLPVDAGGSSMDQVAIDSATPPSGPLTLAQGPSGAQGIAVDDARIYWVVGGANGSVFSVLKDGSGMTTIASGQPFPVDVAVVGTSVYWSVVPGGAGAQCMAMVASTPGSAPAGADAGPSCVTSSADTTVRMAIGGGGLVLLAQGTGANAAKEFIGVATPGSAYTNVQAAGPAEALAATSQRAFLSNKNGDHIDEVVLPGLTPGLIACLSNCGTAPAVDVTVDVLTTNLFWITQNGGVFTAPIAVSNGKGTQLAQLPGSLVRVARDASFVYATGLGSSVLAVPIAQVGDAGAFQSLASAENQPFGIAVDQNAVYWTTADGEVRTVGVPVP